MGVTARRRPGISRRSLKRHNEILSFSGAHNQAQLKDSQTALPETAIVDFDLKHWLPIFPTTIPKRLRLSQNQSLPSSLYLLTAKETQATTQPTSVRGCEMPVGRH